MPIADTIRWLVLDVLALWLALWPASDAVTGSSRTPIFLSPAAEESAAYCSASPASEAPCAGAKAACCGQCQSIGGVVLFATAPPGHLPDLELVGILSAIRIVRPSRSLQPLVRPPIAELLTSI